MVYIVFVFALALASLASLEFMYLITMEASNRELRKRVRWLERQNLTLAGKLTEFEPGERKANVAEKPDESWPEYIEDSRNRS